MLQNPILVPGVHRYSRSQMKKKYKKDGTQKKDQVAKKKTEVKPASVECEKKTPSIPSTILKGHLHQARPKKVRKSVKHPKKIRSSIKPGTICIILSGRYAGKRVINLKVLESGLLLVTGPLQVNGVPLRRINQSNLIATSTTINISGIINSLENVDDAYFSKTLSHYSKRIYGKGRADPSLKPDKNSPEVQKRIKTQQAVDNQLMPLIKEVPKLKYYLATNFTLEKGQRPHLMKF